MKKFIVQVAQTGILYKTYEIECDDKEYAKEMFGEEGVVTSEWFKNHDTEIYLVAEKKE